mgnify:CR=1 FL=1
MDKTLKNIAIYVLIVLMALFAIQLTSNREAKVSELTYPQFYSKVEQGQVKTAELEVDDNIYRIKGQLNDRTAYTATAPKEGDIIKLLTDKKVDFNVVPVPPTPGGCPCLPPCFLLSF